MLELNLPKKEFYDETNNKFITIPAINLKLEHSLISIKKWESRWHIPFLHKKDKTNKQLRDYFYCMSINPVDHFIFDTMTDDEMKKIVEYIGDTMTATTIQHHKKEGESGNPKEILTAEVIYYYMISNNIPVEFQKWHFNQLMTLLGVFSAKNDEQNKKMSKDQAAAHRNATNMRRRAKLHSRG